MPINSTTPKRRSKKGEQAKADEAKLDEEIDEEKHEEEQKPQPQATEDGLGNIVGESGIGSAAANEDARLEALYEQIAWPLADKYGHTYDAFKVALTYVPFSPQRTFSPHADTVHRDPQTVFAPLNIPEHTLSVLITTISRRLTPQPIKLRADIELTCYTSGKHAIRLFIHSMY
jgi:translation initiation factor 2 subunit 1